MSKRYAVVLFASKDPRDKVFHASFDLLDGAIEYITENLSPAHSGSLFDRETQRTLGSFSDTHWHVECSFTKLVPRLNKDGSKCKSVCGAWTEHAAPLKWTVAIPLKFLTGEPKHDLGQVYLASPRSLPVGSVVRLWGRSWERTAHGYVPVNNGAVTV